MDQHMSSTSRGVGERRMVLNEFFCLDLKNGITDVKCNLANNGGLQKPTMTKGG
jgi:hypothetical protein